MTDLNEIAGRISSTRGNLIERELIRIVEVLEGRVPSNAEIARHGMRHYHQDGTTVWAWRGREIIREHPPQFTDGRVAYEVDVLKLV